MIKHFLSKRHGIVILRILLWFHPHSTMCFGFALRVMKMVPQPCFMGQGIARLLCGHRLHSRVGVWGYVEGRPFPSRAALYLSDTSRASMMDDRAFSLRSFYHPRHQRRPAAAAATAARRHLGMAAGVSGSAMCETSSDVSCCNNTSWS